MFFSLSFLLSLCNINQKKKFKNSSPHLPTPISTTINVVLSVHTIILVLMRGLPLTKQLNAVVIGEEAGVRHLGSKPGHLISR